MAAFTAPLIFDNWFKFASRDFLEDVDEGSKNYYRLESCWEAATRAAEEKFNINQQLKVEICPNTVKPCGYRRPMCIRGNVENCSLAHGQTSTI